MSNQRPPLNPKQPSPAPDSKERKSVDLEAVERSVNESRADFLSALEAYDSGPEGDAEVTQKFLSEFLAPQPKRSAIAVAEASEAKDLIRDFDRIQANFASSVQLLNLNMLGKIQQVQIDFIAATLQAVTEDVMSAGATAATEAERALGRAALIGAHVARVQRMATTLLLMRQGTLKAFRGEHLELSWKDLLDRTAQEIEEWATEKGRDIVWETVAQAFANLFGAVAVAFPAAAIPTVATALYRILKRKTPDSSPGGTDTMQQLLEILRREKSLFNDLNVAYNQAMDDISRL
jgi:hypothetical protein